MPLGTFFAVILALAIVGTALPADIRISLAGLTERRRTVDPDRRSAVLTGTFYIICLGLLQSFTQPL